MNFDDRYSVIEPPPYETAAERHALTELGVGFDGRQYSYGLYRYERAADAAAYARLACTRGEILPEGPVEWLTPLPLSPLELERMAEHRIGFNGTRFTFGEYRYERLVDALNAAVRSR
ncbi:MAG: hypothetical protein K2Y51_04100 [Gammaproteobacteria bacterium]|jgi:hypothetical protein|nr:hypothetical protein [Gammaproteobacteria bacterium]